MRTRCSKLTWVHVLPILLSMTFHLTIAQNKTRTTVLETISIKHSTFDEIVLIKTSNLTVGSYDKVLFKKSGQPVFEVLGHDAFDSVDYKVINRPVKNSVKSAFVFVHSFGVIKYIVLWGPSYDCCPRRMTILKADDTGIKQIFTKEFGVDYVQYENEPVYYDVLSMRKRLSTF